MITAQKARELSNLAQDRLELIYKRIEQAAKEGNTEISIDYPLYCEEVSELENLGYNVWFGYSDPDNPNNPTIISWRCL